MNPSALDHPKHDAPPNVALDRPVLITGTPRSGKSLVAKLLEASGEFQRVIEPLAIWNAGMPPRNDDRRTADEANESIRRTIRAACARSAGGRRYVDDLAYHALRIPFAHRVMPEAKIILVVRDAGDTIPEMLHGWTHRDTVAGAIARRRRGLRLRAAPRLIARFVRNYLATRLRGRRESWGPTAPGMKDFAASHSLTETVARQWAALVTIARRDLAALPDGVALEVRHDRLLASPRQEAERIATVCGVENIDRVVRYAEDTIRPDYHFDKRVEPTEDEWALIREIVAPVRRELGYSS